MHVRNAGCHQGDEMNEVLRQLFSKEEPLCDELQKYLYPSVMGGDIKMIHHPLMIEIAVMPQFCAMLNKRFELIKEAAQQAWDHRDFQTYVFRHERPYRLQAFEKCAGELSPSEYWELLASIWTDSENIWENKGLWRKLWTAKLPDKESAMDQDELDRLASLPQELTIYRGSNRSTNQKGLSWTLSRDKAKWFANRFHSNGRRRTICIATVDKKNVHALFLGRNEEEIVTSRARTIGVEIF